jgi:hypothetical protein
MAMADPNYIHEKISNAEYCISGGDGTFEDRLANVTVSSTAPPGD